MKILNGGDQHITDKKPKNRTDNYYSTVLNKFKQELDIAVEEGCRYVILPGDVFNTSKESHLVTQAITNLIKMYPTLIVLCVDGQHDQNFHNPDLKGTALQTLIVSEAVTYLTDKPLIDFSVAFYGAGWGKDIPEITTPDLINVLVLHKMIVDEKLWAEQEGHIWANHLLLKTKFDLIVSGDNHKEFISSKGNRHLVNMGSMMRSTIAQLNHHPAVTVYDTNTKELDIIELAVKPFDEVMQIEKAEKEKERNLQLEAFVHSLKDDEEMKDGHEVKLDFVAALNDYVEKNEIEDSVAEILRECLQ